MRGSLFRLLPIVLVFSCLSGCQQLPKEHNGRPVIGVKWSEGRMVYVLGPKPGDREEIERIAREGTEAAADVKFAGRKPE